MVEMSSHTALLLIDRQRVSLYTVVLHIQKYNCNHALYKFVVHYSDVYLILRERNLIEYFKEL